MKHVSCRRTARAPVNVTIGGIGVPGPRVVDSGGTRGLRQRKQLFCKKESVIPLDADEFVGEEVRGLLTV